MVRPVVTVLMAVYNAASFLPQAIDSILKQTYGEFEFLIVDDGSTDASPEILQSYSDARLRVISQYPNRGQPHALNMGVREARGVLIARQDADDLSLPNRLEKQVAYMNKHPNVALVGSGAIIIDELGRTMGLRQVETDSFSIRWRQVFKNCFVHSSVMFRKKVVELLGGFDPTIGYGEDFDLWSKIVARYNVANLPEPLILYRDQGGSKTSTLIKLSFEENYNIIKRNLLRIWPNIPQPDRAASLLNYLRSGHPFLTIEDVRELIQVLEALGSRSPEWKYRRATLMASELYGLAIRLLLKGFPVLAWDIALLAWQFRTPIVFLGPVIQVMQNFPCTVGIRHLIWFLRRKVSQCTCL